MAALPIIAAGVGLASTFASMNAEGQKAEAAAQSSEYNAQINRYQANAALSQAAEDERRFRIKTSQFLGAQRANLGASGIQKDASALDVLESSASNAELDALTIKHAGQLKAWSYQTGANLDLSKAAAERAGGQNSMFAAGLKGAAGLLSQIPYSSDSGDKPTLKRKGG